MYNTPPITQKARKEHTCTYCFEKIKVGEKYERWASFDDSCYTNKMHLECIAVAFDDDNEYVPGEGERPAIGEYGRLA